MRKLTFTIIFLQFFFVSFAQQADVTKFLGIPVDGTKSAMIQKLKAKGFSIVPGQTDILEGEFNGRAVSIHIVTNNNKVWRISVADQNTCSETEIRIRYNNLIYQFFNNKKYFCTEEYKDLIIPSDEDISYNMSIKNKRYGASFYQITDDDFTYILTTLKENGINYDELNDEQKKAILKAALLGVAGDRRVWFRIADFYGKYFISIFYDNVKNQANGEDL